MVWLIKGELEISVKFFILIGFFLISIIPLMGANYDSITLEEGTPLFRDSTMDKNPHIPIVVNRTTSNVPVVDQKIYRGEHHPLLRKYHIKKIKLPNNKTFWVNQQMRYTVDANGKKDYIFLPYTWCVPFSILFMIAFVVSVCIFKKNMMGEFTKKKWLKNDYLAIASIVFLQYAMLMLLFHISGVTIFAPSDELGYFTAANGINQWDFSGQWRYTIGLALFYIPFIRILNAESFFDIESAFSLFNALLLTPVYLVLGYFIVKKLSKKITLGLISVLLFQLFMFFHQYQNFHYMGEYTYKSFFSIITTDSSYYLHSKFLLFGYNAGSENVSCLLIFACITICLYSSTRIRNLVIVSAIFALACLTRLNNIFFAPLLLWLLWNQFKLKLVNLKYLLKFLTSGALTFLVIFSSQLIINKIQFGSIFTFPYILHTADVYKGFILSCVPDGFDFLCHVNLAYIVPGCLAMVFIKDRKNKLIMILWTMPLFFFFCGYPALGAGSTRFIMITYFAFLASLVLVDFWNKINCRSRTIIILIMTIGLLLTAPSNYQLDILLPWRWGEQTWGRQLSTILNYAIPAISVILAMTLYREPRVMIFAFLFILLFFSCSVWLIAPLMCGLLIYAIIIFIKDIFSAVIKFYER
jgi:hypothetical protein